MDLLQPSQLSLLEEEAIEVEIKYSGFVKRQQTELLQAASQHRKRIPDDLDYKSIQTLSSEAREKLCKVRPKSLFAILGMAVSYRIAHSNGLDSSIKCTRSSVIAQMTSMIYLYRNIASQIVRMRLCEAAGLLALISLVCVGMHGTCGSESTTEIKLT